MDASAYNAALRQVMQAGVSYAAARQTAASVSCGEEMAALLAYPNNTLGIEYIRAGQAQQAMQYMPAAAADILSDALREGDAPVDPHKLDVALLAHLRLQSRSALAALPYISEGLENRLWNSIRQCTELSELQRSLRTRRYPAARLRRILWASLLEITPTMLQGTPPYIRVLGMNERGREILSVATPALPLVTRFSQVRTLPPAAQAVFAAERRGGDLYGLMLPRPAPCGREQQYHMIVE